MTTDSAIDKQLFLAEVVPELAQVEISPAESFVDVGGISEWMSQDGPATGLSSHERHLVRMK